MPAALAVDWSAVQATYAATGGDAEATGRAHGIDPATIRQRAKRGQWKTYMKVEAAKAGLPVPVQPMPAKAYPSGVTHVTKAVTSQMQKLGGKSQLKLAKAVQKGSGWLAKQDGEVIVNSAPALKALVDSGAKLHGWGESGSGQTIRLELIAAAGEQPALDVAVEVTQVPDNQDQQSQ